MMQRKYKGENNHSYISAFNNKGYSLQIKISHGMEKEDREIENLQLQNFQEKQNKNRDIKILL